MISFFSLEICSDRCCSAPICICFFFTSILIASTSAFILSTMLVSSSISLMARISLSASACFSIISTSIFSNSPTSSNNRPAAVAFLSSATASCFSLSSQGFNIMMEFFTNACSSKDFAYLSRSWSASVPFILTVASLFSASSIFDCRLSKSALIRAILLSLWFSSAILSRYGLSSAHFWRSSATLAFGFSMLSSRACREEIFSSYGTRTSLHSAFITAICSGYSPRAFLAAMAVARNPHFALPISTHSTFSRSSACFWYSARLWSISFNLYSYFEQTSARSMRASESWRSSSLYDRSQSYASSSCFLDCSYSAAFEHVTASCAVGCSAASSISFCDTLIFMLSMDFCSASACCLRLSASVFLEEYSADSPASCISLSVWELYSATFSSISDLLRRITSLLSMIACWVALFWSVAAFLLCRVVIDDNSFIRLSAAACWFARSSLFLSRSAIFVCKLLSYPASSTRQPSNSSSGSPKLDIVLLWISTSCFSSRFFAPYTFAFSCAIRSIIWYTPRPRSVPRTSTRSSGFACKKRPYWSCMISAQDLNVKLSIPMMFKISCCVSLYFSFEQSCQSPSAKYDIFNVPFPDLALVLVTLYFLSPMRKVKIIAPDRTESSLRNQGDLPVSSLRIPSRGSS